MRLQTSPALHLTYCLNIHSGERLCDVEEALALTAALRDGLAPGVEFAAGLRLSAIAAEELAGRRLEAFQERVAGLGLYVFTINGFPYGRFHGAAVKSGAYTPDWRTPERLQYTVRLARILAALLPQGTDGSISTVPGSYVPWIRTEADRLAVADGLLTAARALAAIHAETGRFIRLALEPEPGCMLDSVYSALRFLEDTVYPGAGKAEEAARAHLGLCLDTCHASVEGEAIAPAIHAIRAAGVPLAKVQISAALHTPNTEHARRALSTFADDAYLHPLRAVAPDNAVHHWPDLPEALAALPGLPAETKCSTHVHVPLDWPGEAPLSSTRDDLDPECWALLASGICPHLEIETYTFAVLPERLRQRPVSASIAAEYAWVLAHLRDAGAVTRSSPGADGKAEA